MRKTDCHKPCLSRWCMVAIGVTVLCYLANAILGALNQDEGWYLYAARLMMDGEIPHKDFFFTQGLVMPAVYACFGWLWSPQGIYGGRLFTVLLALLALFIAGKTVASSAPTPTDRRITWVALASLLGVNLWYTYFTTIPKAYSLCTLGMAAAFWCLTRVDEAHRLRKGGIISAGLLLAALVNVRVSMGILIPVVMLWLWYFRNAVGRKAWFLFALTAGVTLIAQFAPEWLFWREGFCEAQAFHAARTPFGVMGVVGCLARVLRFNPLLCMMTLALMGLCWQPGRVKAALATHPHARDMLLWFACAVALVGVHLCAPVPYDDYLVPAILPFAMGVVGCFIHCIAAEQKACLTKVLFVAALALTVCASPIAQDWVIVGQDRFWVVKKDEPDLLLLRRVARFVRAEADRLGEETLWTQDTYLAVEADLRVPKGLEMGPFSKPQDPIYTTKLAAWSGYTYALTFPSLEPNVAQAAEIDYLKTVYGKTLLSVPVFGQQGTPLVVAERTMP